MPLHTRLSDILGIEHPIILGGCTGTGVPELAAAVSNAGGLGIWCAHAAGTPERVIKWIKQMPTLTTKPWGINLTSLRDKQLQANLCDAIVGGGAKIVETTGANPAVLKKFKAAGCIIIHKCTSIRHSISAIKWGADIISLDGFECAGLPGEDDVGNFVLQPRGREMLPVPFICSGGVTNGFQLAAALALGADGVNIGTLFCVSKESNWPMSFKERILIADERQTALINRPFRNTSRVLANQLAKDVLAVEKDKKDKIKYADVMAKTSGKRRDEAYKSGDAESCIISAGQGIGLIHNLPTCKEIIDSLVQEAEETIRGRLALIAKL